MSASPGFELPMATTPAVAPIHDAGWERAARTAVLLSWASLFYMAVEGGVGVWQGAVAGSIALVGWGLASFIEGIASAVIVWRFTGSRRRSDTAEHRAQKLVAIQFFILAPYVLVESVKTLIEGGHADITVIGMALTGTSVVLMPLLGKAKHRLAERLGSTATAGEGTQNVRGPGRRGPDRARRERGRRRLVARPADRPVHRLRRRQGRPRSVARGELRRLCVAARAHRRRPRRRLLRRGMRLLPPQRVALTNRLTTRLITS
jgi:hypothetical protein